MNKVLISIKILICLLFITACGEKIYTVSEFKENDKLRNEILAKCKNGEQIAYENCENAQRAQYGVYADELLGGANETISK